MGRSRSQQQGPHRQRGETRADDGARRVVGLVGALVADFAALPPIWCRSSDASTATCSTMGRRGRRRVGAPWDRGAGRLRLVRPGAHRFEAGRADHAGPHSRRRRARMVDAGIPFEEMAEWIGAGLSAREALEQRANGITVEHAASLRPSGWRGRGSPGRATSRRRCWPAWGRPARSQPDHRPTTRKGHGWRSRTAFAGMLTGDEEWQSSSQSKRGAGLGECLEEAARRHGIPERDPVTARP